MIQFFLRGKYNLIPKIRRGQYKKKVRPISFIRIYVKIIHFLKTRYIPYCLESSRLDFFFLIYILSSTTGYFIQGGYFSYIKLPCCWEKKKVVFLRNFKIFLTCYELIEVHCIFKKFINTLLVQKKKSYSLASILQGKGKSKMREGSEEREKERRGKRRRR